MSERRWGPISIRGLRTRLASTLNVIVQEPESENNTDMVLGFWAYLVRVWGGGSDARIFCSLLKATWR